jgi:hypothetical protein
MVIVPGFSDGDPDEIVQTASMTELCDALDAMVTRRTLHVEEHTRQGLAALAVFWAPDFRIGYDRTNDECWADPVRGGTRLVAPSPEALNKLMADTICYPLPSRENGAGPGTSVPVRQSGGPFPTRPSIRQEGNASAGDALHDGCEGNPR